MPLSKIKTNSVADEVFEVGSNLVINGAMQVSQRGTSFSYAHDGTTSAYSLDRFKFILNSNNDQLDGTISQASDGPAGFATSLKWTTGTAETTIDANESLYLEHKIEAQNLQHLEYGASTAKAITLSFYVKSSVTGTFTCGIYAGDSARIIGSTYTINSANTWERKTITFAGDTGGTINNDTGEGLRPVWNLMVGSDFTSVDNSSWAAYTGGSNWAYGHTQNALATTASATWQLTGVQLEIGEQATPFQHEDIGTTLAKCQRYYTQFNPSGSYTNYGQGTVLSSTQCEIQISLPTEMRDEPAFSSSTPVGDFRIYEAGTRTVTSFTASGYSNRKCGSVTVNCSGGGMATGRSGKLQDDDTKPNNFIAWSAEL